MDEYAVHFSTDDETLWFALDRWYFTEKWRGIRFRDDVRYESESIEEFRLKLGICGLSLGWRLRHVEQTSDLIRCFARQAEIGGLKSRNFSVEVYKIKVNALK